MESLASLAGDSTATPQTYKLTAHRYRQVRAAALPSITVLLGIAELSLSLISPDQTPHVV